MTIRTIQTLSLLLTVGFAGAARADTTNPVGTSVPGPSDLGSIAPSQDALEADEEEYDDEGEYDDEEEYEGDFCGGGEMTSLDEARMYLEEGDLSLARKNAVQGLRYAADGWERADAYQVLGSIALAEGDARAAKRYFRKAIAEDPEIAAQARLGLAIAFYRLRNSRIARTEASAFLAESCTSDYVDTARCFAAQHILSITADSSGGMLEAMHEETMLLASMDEYENERVDQWVGEIEGSAAR